MAKDTEIGGLVVKMKADVSDYQKKLDDMEKTTVKTSDKVSSAFSKMSGIMTGVGVAFSGFAITAVNSAMKWGNAVDDLADKTGMAGEEASKLLAIAKSTGISVDEANMMFARFSRSVYNSADAMNKAKAEGKESGDILTKLGVSAVNADGSMRSTIDVFNDVKESVSSLGDGWQKTAFEMELFGRSGAAMHDMLNMSQADIEKVIAKAQAMGLIISSETAAAWEKFERQLNSTKGTLTSLGIGIGNEMLPKLQQLLGSVQGVTKAYVGMNDEQKKTVNQMISVAATAGSAVLAVRALEIAAGVAAPPWLKLALAISGATYALIEFMQAKNGMDNYGEGGEVRKNTSLAFGDKEWKDNYYVKKDTSNMTALQKASAMANNFLSTPIGSDGPNWNERKATPEEVAAIINEKQEPWRIKDDSRRIEVISNPAYLAKLKAQQAEDAMKSAMDDTSKNQFIGSGGGDGGGSKKDEQTPFQLYQEETQKQMQLLRDKIQLEEIDKSTYTAYIAERLNGLEQVAVAEEEFLDKQIYAKELEIALYEAGKEYRKDAIDAAKEKHELGQITAEEYKEAVMNQLNAMSETRHSAEEEKEIMRELRTAYAAVTAEKLQGIERETDAAKIRNEMENELVSHSLSMAKISADNSYNTKMDLLQREFEQKQIYANKEYEIERAKLQKESDLANQQSGPKSLEYKKSLDKMLELDEKYNLSKQKMADDYSERQAQVMQENVDAWRKNIGDIVKGTRSGTDILKDMWFDFIDDVIAKMFTINGESNLFKAILGPMFGLGGGNVANTGQFTSSGQVLQGPVMQNGSFFLNGARAEGGPVDSGSRYLVGERGPELFIPNTSGSIIPNNQLAATSQAPQISVNVVNNTGVQADARVNQPQFDGTGWVVTCFLDGVSRNVQGVRDVVMAGGR